MPANLVSIFSVPEGQERMLIIDGRDRHGPLDQPRNRRPVILGNCPIGTSGTSPIPRTLAIRTARGPLGVD